jgi:hypothetical protein
MTKIQHALDKFGSASSSPTMSSPAAVMVGSQHVAGEETDGQFGPRGDHHARGLVPMYRIQRDARVTS